MGILPLVNEIQEQRMRHWNTIDELRIIANGFGYSQAAFDEALRLSDNSTLKVANKVQQFVLELR